MDGVKIIFELADGTGIRSKNTNSVIKMTFFVHEEISKKIFVEFIIMLNETLSQKFHPYSILST